MERDFSTEKFPTCTYHMHICEKKRYVSFFVKIHATTFLSSKYEMSYKNDTTFLLKPNYYVQLVYLKHEVLKAEILWPS